MKLLATAILGLSLLAAACEDPAANKAKALVSEPTANASSAPAANTTSSVPAAKGDQYSVTSDNSKVEFTGSKVTGKHDGGFKQVTGVIDLVGGKPEDSSVNVEIDTRSVYSDDEGLTKHLTSRDFFEVEKFPKASFRSTKIIPNPANGADAFTVTGDFELHGVSKTISFPATIKVGAGSVNVNAEFSINRKDFGIVYAGKADDLIRDDVVIRLDLKTQKTQ